MYFIQRSLVCKATDSLLPLELDICEMDDCIAYEAVGGFLGNQMPLRCVVEQRLV
jgi:hypothetical protein